MINKRSLQACKESTFGPFAKPLYDSYCFSRIPATVQRLLFGQADNCLPDDVFANKTYDIVLVILIDAFGWRFFDRYAHKYPFLRRFIDLGICSKITSQFPSTTTNHATCMHTGLSVSQSGLYEWFYYEPIVDAAICPLHFSFAKDHSLNTLMRAGFRPKEIFPFSTIYQELQKKNVTSMVFQHKESANSPYSQVMLEGAHVIGYKNLPEATIRLAQELERCSGKNYFFLYFGDIDGVGHEFGPDSQEFENEVDRCLGRLELFWQQVASKIPNACCIVTADHGMSEIRPQDTFYLNKSLPHLEQFIKRNQKGDLIVPCGSSRDFFMHIQEPYLDQVYKELSSKLDGVGAVYFVKELIDQGLFGKPPLPDRLLARLGNLALLPFGTHSIWWYEEGRYDNPFHGHHGGLSRDELETIFLFQEI